jgi:flagellar motility protein MotE (MotC chaperone)
MRIAAIATLAALAILATGAQAQVYCWTTKDGKRQCGDTPPPGVKATTMGAPAAPPAPAEPAKKGAAAKADPEQEFRKRQAEAQKARAKEQQAQEQSEAKQQNCERAREALRVLESGQRISSVDKEGERFYLDEQQTAQETERVRQAVQKNCS